MVQRRTIYRWAESEQVKHLLEFGGELNIYENKVMMALERTTGCVTIENGVLANIMMAMFELVGYSQTSVTRVREIAFALVQWIEHLSMRMYVDSCWGNKI